MEHKGTQRLETERLILRRFEPTDAETMFRNWASNPDVTEFLTWPTHSDVSITQSVLSDWITKYPDPSTYNWAIELKEIHEIIGSIAAVRVYDNIAGVDIGYCMGKKWWGREIMPEALRSVIHFFFEEVGANRVAACHAGTNPKSGRVMDKSGMKQEGILRAAAHNNSGICDQVWHSILRCEFKENTI